MRYPVPQMMVSNVSDDPSFATYTSLTDQTAADYPNPGDTPQTFTGTASVSRIGNTISFSQNGPDRRLTVSYDGGSFRGNASMQFPIGSAKCTITDRDTRNDTMVCP